MIKKIALHWQKDDRDPFLYTKRCYQSPLWAAAIETSRSSSLYCLAWFDDKSLRTGYPAKTFYCQTLEEGKAKLDAILIENGWKLINPDKLGILL